MSLPRKSKDAPCKWEYDVRLDYFETECGNAFQITEGTPRENGFKFCVYCGRPLKELVCE